MGTPKIAELRELSDEELIKEHDRIAPSTNVGVIYYLEELARRDQARQAASMLRYTSWVMAMTFVITVATIVQVMVAVRTFCAN